MTFFPDSSKNIVSSLFPRYFSRKSQLNKLGWEEYITTVSEM